MRPAAIKIQPSFICRSCCCTHIRGREFLGINKLEMNAVKTHKTLGLGAVVATAVFGLFALSAMAQTPPPAAGAPAVAPVKPAAPATPPAAAKAPVTAPAAISPAAGAKPAAAAPKKTAVSACKGLDETGCKANPECSFITPTKADAKTGKVDKAYCRKVAGVAVKKPATAATPATATPATTPAAKPPAAAAKPAAPAGAAPATAAAKPNAPAPATKQ
jgi:hypothetical protein